MYINKPCSEERYFVTVQLKFGKVTYADTRELKQRRRRQQRQRRKTFLQWPNSRICGEREHTTVNFSFSFTPTNLVPG